MQALSACRIRSHCPSPLAQVWYPTTVATQAREFRKTIQAYSVLSQRVSQVDFLPGERDFTPENIAADDLPVHIAQVFERFVPLFEFVLTELRTPSQPRFKVDMYDLYDLVYTYNHHTYTIICILVTSVHERTAMQTHNPM